MGPLGGGGRRFPARAAPPRTEGGPNPSMVGSEICDVSSSSSDLWVLRSLIGRPGVTDSISVSSSFSDALIVGGPRPSLPYELPSSLIVGGPPDPSVSSVIIESPKDTEPSLLEWEVSWVSTSTTLDVAERVLGPDDIPEDASDRGRETDRVLDPREESCMDDDCMDG